MTPSLTGTAERDHAALRSTAVFPIRETDLPA
jgi:hypothetical protein